MEGAGHRAGQVLEKQGNRKDPVLDEARQDSQDQIESHQYVSAFLSFHLHVWLLMWHRPCCAAGVFSLLHCECSCSGDEDFKPRG